MTQEEKDSLAPGDFHSVRSQFDPLFVDQDKVSHAKLIAALTREQEQKLDTEKKKTPRVGF